MAFVSVGILLSDNFLHYSLQVVSSKRPAQFFIVHGRTVLDFAPSLGNFTGIKYLEFKGATVRPGDKSTGLFIF